jgi:hypothetical protein
MAKLLKIATMVVFVMFVAFSANNLVANTNPPETPDCHGEEFTYAIGVMVLPNGCVYYYTYWWRLACGVFHDVIIDVITPAPGQSSDCADDLHEQFKKIQDAVMADIVVIQNPWGARIPFCEDGTTPWQYRFFRPTCRTIEEVPIWIETPEGTNIVWDFARCPGTGYCYELYRYCQELVEGRRVLKAISGGSGVFTRIDCGVYKLPVGDREFECRLTPEPCREE